MRSLPTGSPPLLLFACLMFAGATDLEWWLIVCCVFSVCGLLSRLLQRAIPTESFRWGPLGGVAFIAAGFCLVLEGMSYRLSHDVSKCPNGCYIEFEVDVFGYNRARCRVIETKAERLACRSQLRLPSSRLWLPGGHYRIRGGLTSRDPINSTEIRVWAESRRQMTPEPAWSQALVGAREWLRLKVQQELAPSSQGIVWALLSGQRDLLLASDRDLLSRAGLIHFIAISGLHIGMLLGLWMCFARALVIGLPFSRSFRRYLVIVSYLFACLLSMALLLWWGAPSSALRSAGMWMFTLSGRLLGLRSRGADALGVSGVVLLMLDPFLSRDLGFQLSSLAVAGLIWTGSGTAGSLVGIGTSFRASLSATLCTLPLVAGGFGLVTLVGGSLNFLVLPVVVLGIAPLCIAVLMTWCSDFGVPFWLYDALNLCVAVLREVGEVLGMAAMPLDWHWGHLVLCGFVWFCLRWLSVQMSLVGMLGTAFIFSVTGNPEIKSLRIDALDVGQGDATLIRTPSDYHVLFDTGGQLGQDWGQDGYSRVVLELRKLGVSHLDLVILSHSDPDHTGALEAVLQSFNVKTLLMNYQSGLDARLDRSIRKWCHRLVRCSLNIPSAQTWRHGDVDFVIYPFNSVEGAKLTDNELSSALLVGVGGHNVLMTADLPRWAELVLLRQLVDEVDVLKLGHHGSRTSSDPEFLKSLAPSLVWSSHGYRNRFGHPHQEVVDTLRQLNIEFLTTAELGTLSFELTEAGWRLRDKETNERTHR